jgi:hypothetical protein
MIVQFELKKLKRGARIAARPLKDRADEQESWAAKFQGARDPSLASTKQRRTAMACAGLRMRERRDLRYSSAACFTNRPGPLEIKLETEILSPAIYR